MSLGGMLQLVRRRGFGRLLILDYAQEARISSAELDWQLRRITNQFAPITISRLMGHLGGKKPLSGAQVCVVFTCEQGLDADTAELLSRLTFAATLFVPLDGLRAHASDVNLQPSQLDRLRPLVAAGFEVGHLHCGPLGAHGVGPTRRSHLAACRRNVELQLATKVQSFAYAASPVADTALLRDAAIAGFNLGLTSTAGMNALRPIDPMQLHRHVMTRDTGRDRLEALLTELTHRPSAVLPSRH
jgi:hypothetical protein